MSDQEEDDERSNGGEESDDNPNARQASSDDEGEDISAERKRRPKGGGDDDDSSEEEEDDPEEARRIAEGFIVDEDDEAEARRKRKGKKKRRREHSRASSPDALSEDDLDLLAENTGASRPVKASTSAKPKKLLRRRRSNSIPSSLDSDESDEAELPIGNDLARMFDEMPKRRAAGLMDDDEDDLGDFIEEDEDPNADQEEGAKERRRREKERKKRRKEKAAGLGGVRRGGEGGIDKAAWDDIYDVFGNGDDYDWALEGEEEMMGGQVEGEQPKMEDVFEPSEIQARHLTEEDGLVRSRDIPERHQLGNSTLSSHPSYVPDPFPTFPPAGPAAAWISTRLSPRTRALFLPSSVAPDYNSRPDLHPRFVRSIERALGFMFTDHFEVPFLWEHRRDYLVYWYSEENKSAPEGAKLDLLTRDEVWRVYELGIRYRTLMERKAGLVDVWTRLSPRLAKEEAADDGDDSDGMDIEEEDEQAGNGKKEKKQDPRRVYFESQVICQYGTAEESVEGVVDGMEWLSLRYAREVKEMREEEAEMQVEGRERVFKRSTGESGLDLLRSGRLSQFVKNVGIPVEEVVSVNFSGNAVAFQEDPEFEPETYAEQFTGNGPLSTVEKVLSGAKAILSQDFQKNPTLRRLIRMHFRDRGLVTVVPTDKGVAGIDDFHPYYPFKYMKNLPISELLYRSRYLLMLEAEKEGLVTVKLSLPPVAVTALENQIYAAYKSDSFSTKAEAWNKFRQSVVSSAVRGLLPVGAAWSKEWLRSEVEDFVASSCGARLEHTANQSPYQPRSHEKGDSPSVLAISHGMGDRLKDAVMCVALDEEGRVRETIKIDTLFEDRNAAFKMEEDDAPKTTTPIDEFKAFLARRKPSLIVMGGFSVSTNHLTNRVKHIVTEMAESIAQENLRYGASDEDRERELEEAKIPVIFVPDNVARIYQHSVRAQNEFATLPPTGRYCVGLARYAQSPVHEFCALGTDITALSFDNDGQKLVPREKLLVYLERALVNVVNDVGVLINDAVNDTYMQHVLPYVSGLGPRKAAQLIKDIVSKSGGAITNRLELMRLSLLTPTVFDNAAGFLEIKSDPEELELTGEDVDDQPDPLDNTRIHPADYEFARKMAENALELDEEDVTDDHPSKSVVRLMNDESNAEKLSELNLDDFAENLREIRQVEKRNALEVIKNEILAPGKDHRYNFHIPTPWEILTMLSGETEQTLKPGFIVTGRVQLVRDDKAIIQLASGVEGEIALEYVSDEGVFSCNDVLQKGATVQVMIINVQEQEAKVHLSIRKSDLASGDKWRKPTLEEPYDRALMEQHAQSTATRKRKEGGPMKRQIDHPNFFNMNGAKAEEHLASQQRGDVVIRPSSKGANHLAVTWKVDEGIYQHLDVEELGPKPNPASLGSPLRVSGKYTYTDLDELIVNHVKATVRSIEELMKSDKFKGKSTEELDSFLKTFVLAHPGKSIYAFGLDRHRPGYFSLAFLNKSTTDGGVIQRWPVRVNPGSYQLGEADLPGVLELCNAFKIQYEHRSKGGPSGAGGRTPYAAGGRTPAYGGRTPMAMAGGRTPMAAMAGGGRTPAGGRTPGGTKIAAAYGAPVPGMQYGQSGTPLHATGRTPNPYAQAPMATGMTPYGAGAGAYSAQPQAQMGMGMGMNYGGGGGGGQPQMPYGGGQPQMGYGGQQMPYAGGQMPYNGGGGGQTPYGGGGGQQIPNQQQGGGGGATPGGAGGGAGGAPKLPIDPGRAAMMRGGR